mmetsp:Transcript_66802/g.145155  ORF Transcript_66802/g.145155 Transcript_66802/m.145155 type:complete len:601 (-) Transcript_66802:107-1909(-)
MHNFWGPACPAMSSTSGDRAPPAPPALAGKSAPTATTSVPKAPPQRPADASKMTTKMECSDRGYPPNSPGEFDSQSAGTPSSKEEEEKGDYAREIAILRGQFVDLQSSVLGRLDDADSLKDKFERLHQAYRTASTDTGERLTGMEYDIKKSKTERASESTLLKQVQRENEEMRQQLANQKAKMDEAARRHAEELSSGLKQLKDELLSSMEEQIDGQNLKRKQLKAYWETELTMRCGSVKESNHWTADLDSIKVLVQKETQGLMELKGNAEAQITEMKSRLCEFSTESQELNDALKKLEKQLDDERKKRRSDMKELATKKEVAELRESLQAEVQDERTRVEQLRDEFEVILDRVNKVDKLEEACNALKQDVQRLSAELSKATSKMDYQASASQEAGLASNSRPEAQSASAAAAARTPVSEPNDEAAVAQPEQQSEQSGPTRTPSPSPRQTPTPIQSARSAPAAAAATAQQPQQPPRAPAHGGGTRDDARDAAAPVLLQASVSPFDIPPLHEWEVSAAYARAQEILENLKIFRRKIVDHEDRRRQLKSVHLQVHPDKGDTPEEKELRVILWAWWQTWMENNGEWYVVGTPGAKMQSEEAIEL